MSENVDVRLRFLGGKLAAAEAKGFGRALAQMGGKARTTGRDLGLLTGAGRGFRDTIGGLGATARSSALGVGALGSAMAGIATKNGLSFNATMESNEVAFANFLGSTEKARAYLDDLYGIASRTPFEFPELTGAARRFLAFGFSAGQARDTLVTIGERRRGDRRGRGRDRPDGDGARPGQGQGQGPDRGSPPARRAGDPRLRDPAEGAGPHRR